MSKKLSRRDFLKVSAGASAGVIAVTKLGKLGAANVYAAPPGQDQVTIQVWHVDETELDPVIEAFKAANPNIDVEFQFYVWGNFFERLETAYAGGTPPDVHRQDDDEIPFFVQRGVLMSLTEALGELNPDDFFWQALQSTAINGDIWVSVPAMRVDNLLINKTMFEEAGVELPPLEYPSENWTWTKLVETANAFSNPDALIYGLVDADNTDFAVSLGRSLGGDVMTEDCMTFVMNEEPMVRAIQNLADLMQVSRGAVDPETQEALGGGGEMFIGGQAGMIYQQSRFPSGIEEVDFEWEIRAIPTYEGHEPNNFLAIECYAVPAVTEQPEAATKFAVFLMGTEAQEVLAANKPIIPFSRAAAADIWIPNGPTGRELLVESLNYARSNPFAVGFGRVQDIAWPMIQEVYLGQRTAQDAMDEAKPLADEILAEVGGCLGGGMES